MKKLLRFKFNNINFSNKSSFQSYIIWLKTIKVKCLIWIKIKINQEPSDSYSGGFLCPGTGFCKRPWQNPPCWCHWVGPAFLEAVPFHCKSANSNKLRLSFYIKKSTNAPQRCTQMMTNSTALTPTVNQPADDAAANSSAGGHAG